MAPLSALQKAAISEIVLDDDIGDRIEHKLDIVGVRCDGELRVDVLRVPAPIQSLKLLLNVITRLLICTPTCLHSVSTTGYQLLWQTWLAVNILGDTRKHIYFWLRDLQFR